MEGLARPITRRGMVERSVAAIASIVNADRSRIDTYKAFFKSIVKYMTALSSLCSRSDLPFEMSWSTHLSW